MLVVPTYTNAQTEPGEGPASTPDSPRIEGGIPIEKIVAAVARKTGKKFVLDPRVHASVVLIGQDPATMTYPQLLAVLEVYGYAAVDAAGYVQIVPAAMIRQEAIATITSKDIRPDAEYVTQIIPLKYISAAWLVPVFRPMLPQQGHLVARGRNEEGTLGRRQGIDSKRTFWMAYDFQSR